MRLLLAAILLVAATRAHASEIAVALTQENVEVDAGFAGAHVVLFGALTRDGARIAPEEAHDIVAVVRGPETLFRMRPIERKGVIWRAGPAMRLRAPGILLTSATRPVEEIATLETRRALGIGADEEEVGERIDPANAGAAAHIKAVGAGAVGAAFLDAAGRSGLVTETAGAVDFKKDALFAINVDLPPTTPVGDYKVDVFLFQDGALLSRDSAALSVGKVGIERGIYEFAHTRPIAYGLGCVLIALAAGWLAAAAFRK